jgi:hypothetical protein
VTASGQPVTAGAVAIDDEFNGQQAQLGSAALNAQGTASITVSLEPGTHSLTAQYAGNATFEASASAVLTPAIVVATPCEFTVAVSNLQPSSISANTMTLTAGQTGSATVTVSPSPEFTSTLTAPMFVTLSCSALPDLANCTVTPENVEILSTTPASCPAGSAVSQCPPSSTMQIQTYSASTTIASAMPRGKGSSPIVWAFLLPGALGLGGLAWGARRRQWLRRISLIALVGVVTLLGTTACNPRYQYEHHGPQANPATPAGTYTINVTAQTSNGVNSLAHTTTFVLTVQ